MSVVIKCDCCKKMVDEIEDVHRLKDYETKQKPPYSDVSVVNKWDMCEECYQVIMDTIKNCEYKVLDTADDTTDGGDDSSDSGTEPTD